MINKSRLSFLLLMLVCGTIVLPSCRDKSKGSANKNFNHPDCKNVSLWKKYDTPPGADPSVPDSLGGNGFEKIAESMGFKTYTVKDDEIKYFGDSKATTGGEFNVVMEQFPPTLRPEGENSSTIYTRMFKLSVFETLLGEHPVTKDDIPLLASHWKVSDDKLTYTFRIDPNARWSDGKPVTSEDVVATWKLLIDEGLKEPSNIQTFGKFEQPVAKSKYIVEVKSKVLNFRNFLYFAKAMQIYPAHEIANLTGTEFLNKYNFNMLSGTGEYIVLQKEIKEGQKITLTRRDDYWAKDYNAMKFVGNFDKYSFTIVNDNPTLEYEKFKKGEGDIFRFTMMTTEKWIKDTDYEAIKNGWVKRARVFCDGPWGTAGYAFNMRKAPFDDIRIRKAMSHLLPRKQIIEKLLFNEYEPYDTQYPNTEWGNPRNPKIEYDPELASKLLDEAGWSKRNQEGIRTKDGKTLSFVLPITKATERFVTPYQQELKKAGIDMQLKFEDWATTIRNIQERNFNVFHFSYGGIDPPNPETSLNSRLADQNNNNNIYGVKNARIDELCRIYDTTFDVKKQIKIIQETDSITSAMFLCAFQWNPRGFRIAYWDKFGMPEYVLPRTASISYLYLYPISQWWYDAEKAKKLEEARASKKPIDGSKEIQVVTYWKDLKKSS